MPTIPPARDSAKPRPGPDRVASYTRQIGRGGASCLTHELLALPAHPPGLALGLRRRESLGMTMSVHDALEAWAEGRLSVERALALTGEHSVADLLVLCALCDVPRPLLAGPPDPAPYSPDAIRHLAVIDPIRRRPAGVEDVPDPDLLALSPEGADIYFVEDGPGSGRRSSSPCGCPSGPSAPPSSWTTL